MSGHNKWSTIKHKKAAVDAKRGKIFSRISKELTRASRIGGGDIDMNPRLRTAINAAKNANMPNDNVERAIKKGTGELGGGALEELEYEGFAPGGVAVLIEVLTDNRNRTAAEIRNVFTRAGTSLAGPGAVSRLFSRKARFVVEGEYADEVKLMELLFEAGVDVEDISVEDGEAEIIAPPDAFDDIVGALEGAGIEASDSGVVKIPETFIPVTELSVAKQVSNFLEALEEQDDVQAVSSNAEFTDDVMAKLEDEG